MHQSVYRKSGFIALCLSAAVFLAQCSQSSPPADGTLTGVASPCIGPAATSAQISDTPVIVRLTQGSRVVAQQTLKGTHQYRFVVPAGEYVIVVSGGSPPARVLSRSGMTADVNIPSVCR